MCTHGWLSELLARWGPICRLCADTDIRDNIFTADKNLMQARIADKTADTSLKLLKLIPAFYCFDKSVL
jgi:hypothetical protein